MENLTSDKSKWNDFWDEIKRYVTALVEPTNQKLSELLKDLKKLHSENFPNFYKIRYGPGEVIIFKGTYSGYAYLLLRGKILVNDLVPVANNQSDAWPTCWHGVFRRRLQNWASIRLQEKPDGGPVRGLLHRPVRWLAQLLLATIRASSGERMLANPFLTGRTRQSLDAKPIDVIATCDEEGSDLPLWGRRFLGVTQSCWNEPHVHTLMADDSAPEGSPCEVLLMSRTALQQIIKATPQFYHAEIRDYLEETLPRRLADNDLFRGSPNNTAELPVTEKEFRELVGVIDNALPEKPLQLLRFKKGEPLYCCGKTADALFLIMNGTVRVSQNTFGEELIIGHAGPKSFFGVSCIEPEATWTENVVALTSASVLKLEHAEVQAMVKRYPDVGSKLSLELKQLRGRDAALRRGQLPPPEGPPEEIAKEINARKGPAAD